MTIRKNPINEAQYYHFYNRGNSKQAIFLDDQDYDRFAKLLFVCNSEKNMDFRTNLVERKIDAWRFDRGEPLISICAWVLMPNHFHLYIYVPKTKISTSSMTRNNAIIFMQKIGTAYSKYFNFKYNRTGSLFEGRFKSIPVNNDAQARYLFSYIHLNPVKLIQSNWKERGIRDEKAAFQYAKNYKYSSLKDWLGVSRKESMILNKSNLKDIMPKNFSPRQDLFYWLSQNEKSI